MFCNLKIDEKEAEMKKNESESYMDTVCASGAVVGDDIETESSTADPPPSNQDNDNNGSSTAA